MQVMQVDNLILEKSLGKGNFGEVYLTRIKGDNNNIYATKIYDRERLQNNPAQLNYLNTEINIMHSLHHPNIVKFAQVKKTKKHFYIVMEFCNGGELSDALEKYKLKYGHPFTEEIVQHLMRQIIGAFKYIHENNVMHRDIKLENILLSFKNEEDKKNLNMMNATAKIIDFGFACKIEKNTLKTTAVGSPMCMDPVILKKLTCEGKLRQLGYDKKADIWSLGGICYQMLMGKFAFDAEGMDELVDKIEKGIYKVPTSLSREVISFLNGMLQYDAKARLTAEDLSKQEFLTGDVKNFHKMNLEIKEKEIEIDTKKNNKTIWSCFKKDDEDKLVKINPGNLPQQQNNLIQQQKTLNPGNMNKNTLTNEQQKIKSSNTFEGSQHPGVGYSFNSNNNQFFGPVLPSGNQGAQGVQGVLMPQNGIVSPAIDLNSQSMTETNYIFCGDIYNA